MTENIVKDTVSMFANILAIPATLATSGYVLYSQTNELLRRNLHELEKNLNERAALEELQTGTPVPRVNLLSPINDERMGFYGHQLTECERHETATIANRYQKGWSKANTQELKELGYKNIFQRLEGLTSPQRMEVIVQSVAAGALVVGFWALLDQLRHNSAEKDKSI